MAALLLGFSVPAKARVLFTATETAPASITQQPLLGNEFSFGYEYVQYVGVCSLCLSASTGDGTALGNFGFRVSSLSFDYITEEPGGGSAVPSGGMYVEHYSGYGDFLIAADIGSLAGALLGGGANFFGVTVWAAPGSTTATMEFDINGDGVNRATSDLLDVSGPLYLDVTGTPSDVTLTDLTPGQTPDYLSFTNPLSVDFTITLSDTPFSPSAASPPPSGSGSGSDLPEPWTSTVMMSGLLALAFARRVSGRSI